MEYAEKTLVLPAGLISLRLRIKIAYCEEIVYTVVIAEEKHGGEPSGELACGNAAQRFFLQLAEYLLGKRTVFDVAFAAEGTDFQKKVWRELVRIPYGQTISYAELAARVGKPKAYRAVARACHDNPLPLLVPCHRVIAKNGSFGGYACGTAIKTALLNLEQNGRINNDNR